MDGQQRNSSEAISECFESMSPRASFDEADLRSILTNLSQELCRPLTSLRVGFDLLLAENTTPISSDQREHVDTMVSLCDSLLRLTRNSLEYAGLVQGSHPINLGTFAVSSLIREIDRQYESIATSKQIRWLCRFEGPDSSVTTDASRCQRIVGNLIDNALNVTPEGGCIELTGRVEASHWSIKVLDSGPGIPPEELSRVFEPFYRLARDEHSNGARNGLGLATCREMVVQLGGQIQIQSNLGKGTSVIVKLPCHPAEPVQARD